MTTAVRHAGLVNDKGELVLSDPSAWRAAVSRHKGRSVWVSVVRQSQARTMPQNKYYWSVIVSEIAGYCGEDRDSIHEYLKAKFLGVRNVELLDGQRLELPPTTRTLTVEQMTEYIEQVRQWAATFLGLPLPDADRLEAVL